MHPQQLFAYVIPIVVIVIVMAFRMRRMMRTSFYNIELAWILPAILLGMTIWLLTLAEPHGAQWLWFAGITALGAVLGWFRGASIKMTVDPQTGRLLAQGSAAAIIFLVLLAVARRGLQYVMESNSAVIGMSGQMLNVLFLAMATGLFVTRTVEMMLRGRKLLAIHQANPALITTDEAGV